MNEQLLQAIAVTAELCGREFSEGAMRQFERDLSGFALPAVLLALDRCRKELQRPLTLAAVLERIEDGRPGPEEAWALLPRDESQTVVWTTEMRTAWGIARELDDSIAARMAFKEAYSRIVAEARAERKPVAWQASLGQDKDGREPVLQQAIAQGRLTQAQVEKHLLPYHKPTEAEHLALLRGMKMVEDKREAMPANTREFLPKRKVPA